MGEKERKKYEMPINKKRLTPPSRKRPDREVGMFSGDQKRRNSHSEKEYVVDVQKK